MLTFIVAAIEMMCFGVVDNNSGKDKLLAKFVPVLKPTRKRCEHFIIEQEKGGAWQTVDYAIKQGKTVINLNNPSFG